MSIHMCIAKGLQDLQICTECQNDRITCSQCFKAKHYNPQTKLIHQSQKFEQSSEHNVFMEIMQLNWLFSQKILKSLGEFNIVFDVTKQKMINLGFEGSEFYAELFQGDEKAISQFNMLKKIYSKEALHYRSMHEFTKILTKSGTSDLVKKNIRLLNKPSIQELTMKSHLDYYIKADRSYLENFILTQQQYFIEYIENFGKDQGEDENGFSIYKYLEWREKDQQKPKDPVYYSRPFTAFIVETYQKDSKSKGIFTTNQYVINFWRYFHTTVNTDATLKKFFDEEIAFYRQYQKLMKNASVMITYMSFRVWRLNNGTSEYLPHLKNHYFLYSFLQSYLQRLISRTYDYNTYDKLKLLAKQDWTHYIKYIKEYSQLIESRKQQQMDLENYESYYTFRTFMEKFIQTVVNNEKIEYQPNYMRDFLNQCFYDRSRTVKIKTYQEYFKKKQVERIEKKNKFIQAADRLKQQLIKEEGEKFYEFVFLNFVSYCRQKGTELTQELYKQFKDSVLQTMDQTYIQETQEKFKRGDFNQQPEQEDLAEQGAEKKEIQNLEDQPSEIKLNPSQVSSKLKEIDEFEIQMAQKYKQAEQEIEIGDQEPMEVCLCCNNNPYNCKNQECEMMGCCTACCL